MFLKERKDRLLAVIIMAALFVLTAVFGVALLRGEDWLAGAEPVVAEAAEVETSHSWAHGSAIPLYAAGGTLSGGNYYLSSDIKLSSNLTISGTVNLCLNGYTLTGNGNGSVITVGEGATLNLYDEEGGTVTGGTGTKDGNSNYYGGGVYMAEGSTFNMYGGTITGNTATYGGGGVYVYQNSTFTMNGGEISNNTASRYGGGVYAAENSAFNMYGGTISDNTGIWDGGGVCVADGGMFTMHGGTISGNMANSQGRGGGVMVLLDGTFTMRDGTISGNTAISGGGVYVYVRGEFTMLDGTISGNTANFGGGVNAGYGTFTMSGGTITANTATKVADNMQVYSGGVLVGSQGKFNVEGDVSITGNTMDEAASNVYLEKGTVINVSGALDPKTKIGVTLVNNYGTGAFTKGFAGNGSASNFVLDDSAKCVGEGGNELKIGAHVYSDPSYEGAGLYAPTCTESGRGRFYCANECGSYEDRNVDALGHTYEFVEGQAATCTDGGWNEHYYCAACNSYFLAENGVVVDYDEDIVIPALNHAFTELQHSAEGHWYQCARCDETTKIESHSGGTATHFEKANCSICGEAYGEVIAHTYNKQVVATEYLGSEATCEKRATYYYSCECGEKGVETFETGEYAAHTLTSHTEAKGATCTDAGNIEYWTCEVCEKNFKDNAGNEAVTNVTIPALNHAFTELQHSAEGHWYQCARCDETTKIESHSGGTATHFEKANCSICGEAYGEVIAHTYNKQVVATEYLASEATCEKRATYYYSCECGEKGVETFETGEYAAHKLTSHTEAKGATCTDAGNIEYWTCEVCEKNFKDNAGNEAVTNVTIPALNHAFTVLQHSAEGHWYQCVRCDETTEVEAHKGGEATHFEKAECSVCGEKYGDVIAHTFHKQVVDTEYLASEATCEKLATYYYSCECGEKGTETFETGELAEHSLTSHTEAKDATCTDAGNIEYWTCEVCGKNFNGDNKAVEDVTMSALGHDFSMEWTTSDEKHWHECSRCDEISAESEHTWVEGEIIQQPTATEKGEKEFTCSECGDTKTEEIPATGSQGGEQPGEEPGDEPTTDEPDSGTPVWVWVLVGVGVPLVAVAIVVGIIMIRKKKLSHIDEEE